MKGPITIVPEQLGTLVTLKLAKGLLLSDLDLEDKELVTHELTPNKVDELHEYYETNNLEHALDEFHSCVPINTLDNFEITAEPYYE